MKQAFAFHVCVGRLFLIMINNYFELKLLYIYKMTEIKIFISIIAPYFKHTIYC